MQDFNADFDLVCRNLGYGDPGEPDRPALWFCGIEEGQRQGEPWLAEEIEAIRNGIASNGFFSRVESTPKSRGSMVVHYASAIARRAFAIPEGQDIHLVCDGSRTLHMNVYPLTRHQSADGFDVIAERFFGKAINDPMAFLDYVRSVRFPHIHEALDRYRPAAVVAFGERAWKHQREAFGCDAQTEEVIDLSKGRQARMTRMRNGATLILTKFFRNTCFSYADAAIIGEKLSRLFR